MANEFKVKHGLIVDGALTASFAYTTASVALNAINANTAGSATSSVQSAFATQSLFATASISQSVSATNANASYFLPFVPTTSGFNGTYATTSLTVNPSNGSLTASQFNGNLIGTASNASTASFLLGSVATATQANFATQSLFATSSIFASSSVFATSASWASSSISASYAVTSSNLIGWNFVNTASTTQSIGPNSQSLVLALSTASYLAAFFDYAAASGSNIRAGTIFGAWVAGTITYSEVCTVDVGLTNDVTMSLGIAGALVQLSASVNVSSNWNIRALGRFV